jgi:hypothetical protein
MKKKISLIVFSIFFVPLIIADEPGDILLVVWDADYIINVDYAIIYDSGQDVIQGVSGDDGWIRYNEPIVGNYTLALNLDPGLPWDLLYWEREGYEEEVLRTKETLKGEYEIINAVQNRSTRVVRVALEGGKKYIINIELQTYGISE